MQEFVRTAYNNAENLAQNINKLTVCSNILIYTSLYNMLVIMQQILIILSTNYVIEQKSSF